MATFGEKDANAIAAGTLVEPMGSYRRGKSKSGDMDVLIILSEAFLPLVGAAVGQSSDQNLALRDFLRNFLNRHLKSIALTPTELEKASPRGRMQSQSWVEVRTPTWIGIIASPYSKKARRLDIKLYTGETMAPTALLYFTGSAVFNRALRWWAVKQTNALARARMAEERRARGEKEVQPGDHLLVVHLSDQGLFPAFRKRVGGQALVQQVGGNFGCRSEREVFEAIGVAYVPPFLRDVAYIDILRQMIVQEAGPEAWGPTRTHAEESEEAQWQARQLKQAKSEGAGPGPVS